MQRRCFQLLSVDGGGPIRLGQLHDIAKNANCASATTAAAASLHPFSYTVSLSQAATATASAVRLQRSLKRKVRQLTVANAKVTKRNHRLHSRVRRGDKNIQLAEEETERMVAHAKQLQTELKEKDEKLEWLQAQSQHTRKQLADSKQYRKKVAGDKKDLAREMAATRAALDACEREAAELLEDYEQLQLEALLFGEPTANDKKDENEQISVFHSGHYDERLRAVIYWFIRANVGKDRIAELVSRAVGDGEMVPHHYGVVSVTRQTGVHDI